MFGRSVDCSGDEEVDSTVTQLLLPILMDRNNDSQELRIICLSGYNTDRRFKADGVADYTVNYAYLLQGVGKYIASSIVNDKHLLRKSKGSVKREEVMSHQEILQQLANVIISIKHSYPLRVAIDGIDAAGKTTLADGLTPLIAGQGRPVIRASVDGFHRPRHERYRRGRDSPEGYYEDSFNYAALQKVLLMPLGPFGTRHYRRAVFDVGADVPLETKEEVAPVNAVLLFDGVFLLRPELEDMWDYRIFVDVDFEVALQRAIRRDLPRLGSTETVRAHYLQRYFPGQRLYFQMAQPQKRADVIVENNDPAHPELVFPSKKNRNYSSLMSFTVSSTYPK